MMPFLSAHAGLIGLLFFFLFFCAVLYAAFRPGAKNRYQKFSHIPFEESGE